MSMSMAVVDGEEESMGDQSVCATAKQSQD